MDSISLVSLVATALLCGTAGLIIGLIAGQAFGSAGKVIGLVFALGGGAVGAYFLADDAEPYVDMARDVIFGTDIRDEAEQLLRRDRMLAAFFDLHPGDREAILDRLQNAFERRDELGMRREAEEMGEELVESLLPRFVPLASDEKLANFSAAMATFAQRNQENPEFCYRALFPYASGGTVRRIPRLQMVTAPGYSEFEDAMIALMDSDYDEPRQPDMELAQASATDIMNNLPGNLRSRMAFYMGGGQPANEGEFQEACDLMTAWLTAWAEHEDSAALMRASIAVTAAQ